MRRPPPPPPPPPPAGRPPRRRPRPRRRARTSGPHRRPRRPHHAPRGRGRLAPRGHRQPQARARSLVKYTLAAIALTAIIVLTLASRAFRPGTTPVLLFAMAVVAIGGAAPV